MSHDSSFPWRGRLMCRGADGSPGRTGMSTAVLSRAFAAR
ncbi:hypothetical protein SSAG_03972 [Streptomyces sp. Mg1]|nr:hypothetical protein SSAG_03972 [Streptomyces sp. Mg1]